jgi:hypothetical protein
MLKKKSNAIAIKSLVPLLVLAATHQAWSQDAATTYTKMAPVDQYLMPDQSAEVALARSAAPESIARDAEVLVLGRHGFETAVKGKNGFVCIVGRSWTSTTDAEFWNPKVRVPMCVNAAAAHTYLLRITKITDLALAGHTLAGERSHGCRRRQKRTAANGTRGDVLHDGKGRIRRRQQPSLAFPPNVFLFGHRRCNLGSEPAGFSRRCCRGPPGAANSVRDSCATVVRRNGSSSGVAYSCTSIECGARRL